MQGYIHTWSVKPDPSKQSYLRAFQFANSCKDTIIEEWDNDKKEWRHVYWGYAVALYSLELAIRKGDVKSKKISCDCKTFWECFCHQDDNPPEELTC